MRRSKRRSRKRKWEWKEEKEKEKDVSRANTEYGAVGGGCFARKSHIEVHMELPRFVVIAQPEPALLQSCLLF